MRQHFDVAAYRQQLLRPPGIKAPPQHLRATYAHGLQIGPTRFQSVQQQAGQQIT